MARGIKFRKGLNQQGPPSEEIIRKENERRVRQIHERQKILFEVGLITYAEYLVLCSCQKEMAQALGVQSIPSVSDNGGGLTREEGTDIWTAYRWLLDENLINPNEHVALCSFYVAETYGL
jgi:hypothetical protein